MPVSLRLKSLTVILNGLQDQFRNA